MLHHIALALFVQLQLAIAQTRDGGGLRVWPDSGPLAVYADPPSQLTWRYNGELDAWGDGAGLDYVPMIKDDSALGNLSEVIAKWTADPSVTHVLGYKLPYREVPQYGTHKISPSDGVNAYMEIRKHVVKDGNPLFQVGGPSIGAYHDSIDGDALEWFKEWNDECKGLCPFDFMVVEYEGNNHLQLQEQLEKLHNEFQKPIWITSIDCWTPLGMECTYRESFQFLENSIGVFKAKEYIERWVWDGAFPAATTEPDSDPMAMLNPNGTLNDLGRMYIA